MEPAKQLKRIAIRFYGPHSPDLFKLIFVRDEWDVNYDHFVVGTGESRAVAAARAVSHMRDLEVKEIIGDIEAQVQCVLPRNAAEIEGDNICQLYCVIGLDVER